MTFTVQNHFPQVKLAVTLTKEKRLQTEGPSNYLQPPDGDVMNKMIESGAVEHGVMSEIML